MDSTRSDTIPGVLLKFFNTRAGIPGRLHMDSSNHPVICQI
jgi:hypothetical protein